MDTGGYLYEPECTGVEVPFRALRAKQLISVMLNKSAKTLLHKSAHTKF